MIHSTDLLAMYWALQQKQTPEPDASDIPLPYYEKGAIWAYNGSRLDTGLMTDPTDEWIIVTGKNDLNGTGHICGGSYSKTDSNTGIYSGGGNNGHRLSFAFGNISGSGELEVLDEDLSLPHEIRVKHSTGEVWIDGVFKGQKQVTGTIPHPAPLMMFGQSRTSGSPSSYGFGYIRSFKIIRNGVVVRDFMAVGLSDLSDTTIGFIDMAAIRNGTGQVFYQYGNNDLNNFDVRFTVEIPSDDLTYKFISTMEFKAPIKTGTTVDWGDGVVENIENSRYFQHTYAAPGEYQIHAMINYADGVFTLTCDSDDSNALKIKRLDSVSGQYVSRNFLKFARNADFDVSAIKNLRSISKYGFKSCNALTMSALPKNLVSIGYGGFEYCQNITVSKLPPYLTYIGGGAFNGCTKLAITSIPETVIYIGDSAFKDCANMPLREMRAQVTEICNNAFSGCSKLALSRLPDAVTTIGVHAFSNCSEMPLSELPSHLAGTIGVEAFWICPKITVSTIPEGVVTIDQRAFAHCYSITSMEFPSTLETLAAGCFNNCSGLHTVVFNGIPTSISSSAFNNCPNLADIYVPWYEGDVADAPWGATNATVHYNHQV